MNNIYKLLIYVLIALINLSCDSSDKELNSNDLITVKGGYQTFPDCLALAIKSLPINASLNELLPVQEILITEIQKTSILEMDLVYAALDSLRKQPNIIEALVERYSRLETESYYQRQLTVQIIGELRRDDAFSFLRNVVWTVKRLINADVEDGLSPKDYEDMIQVKATHGIGYLRNLSALNELLKIIIAHPSLSVKIAAIDSYMWNNNDSDSASKFLIANIPSTLHKYINRPRYVRGADMNTFDAEVEEWLKKWDKDK